jgi:hypothetical protein
MDISQILLTFDTIQEKNKKILKCKNDMIKSNNDTKPDKIIFTKNNKLFASAEIYCIGMMNIKNNIWIWSWSDYGINNNSSILSRKVLNYGMDLIIQEDGSLNNNNSNNFNIIIKLFLTNSRLKLYSNLEFELILALSMNILNADYIFNTSVLNADYVAYNVLINLVYH